MRDTTFGEKLVQEELNKQSEKGYTVYYDRQNNNNGQLLEAAKSIIEEDIHTRIDCKPKMWDLLIWHKMCAYPKERRLAIAASWIIADLNKSNK